MLARSLVFAATLSVGSFAYAQPAAPESDGAQPAARTEPLAGYRQSAFFLRDEKDNLILYPAMTAQIDHYDYFGSGVSHTNLKSTFAFKRVSVGFAGEVLKNWYFRVEMEMGRTALDNPQTTQTARTYAALAPAFLGWRVHPALGFLVGQSLTPFTMENSTPPRFRPFMEKPLAVSVLGPIVNNGLDLMASAWGVVGDEALTYTVAWTNGAGPNRLDTDGGGDLVVRLYSRPLANVQIGGSFAYGSRDPLFSYGDYNAMATQGNYTFWRPAYANPAVGRTVHVLPAHRQLAAAGELRVPFDVFDLQSEIVYVDNGTREVIEGFQNQNPADAPGTLGFGRMHGYAYYIMGAVWLFGPRALGIPGEAVKPFHVDLRRENTRTGSSLQLMVRWEQLRLRYDGYGRTAPLTSTGEPAFTGEGPYDGDIRVRALSFGANYFITKHLRLTGQWTAYAFPDSGANRANRALAPAPGGTTLHELLFRAQAAF